MLNLGKANRLLFFLFPFRDSVGFNFGVPLRIGEIYTVIYSLILFLRKKTCQIPHIDNYIIKILLLLIINLFLVLFVSFINFEKIDEAFMIKYVVRNSITILLIFAVWRSSVLFNEELIAWGVKWNVILQIIAALVFFGLSQRIYMNQFISIWDIQTANYGGVELPRYSGTSSETGYLGPMLALPLMYFLYTRKSVINKFFLTTSIVLLLISLSSFNYVLIVLALLYFNYKKNRKKTLVFVFLLFIFSNFIIALILLLFKGSVVEQIIDMNINKMVGYLTFGAYGELDWSANDRNEHLSNAFNFFINGNIAELLIGHGTGAYSFFASHHSAVLVENVEEAYNLYLSTLTDRGIIGLALYLPIFFYLYRFKTDNPVSNSIWFAILVQLLHYFIVGNMWLYYVWQEILFLIGYERYRFVNKIKCNV